MKIKRVAIIVPCVVVILLALFIGAVWGINDILTNLIENANVECKGQKFTTAEEAFEALEAREIEQNDPDLDYCPPYKLLYSFDCDENTIVVYSYCYSFNGWVSSSYAVRALKHNDDGTLSFNGALADLHLSEPDGTEDYYYYTNIETQKGKKSISFLYLPNDSNKDIYVDGIKAEKVLVSIEDQEFYICYAISRRDTFLSNVFTPISKRHRVEIK